MRQKSCPGLPLARWPWAALWAWMTHISLRSLPPALVPHRLRPWGRGSSPHLVWGLRPQGYKSSSGERITGPEGPRNQHIGPGRWFKSRWRGHLTPNWGVITQGKQFFILLQLVLYILDCFINTKLSPASQGSSDRSQGWRSPVPRCMRPHSALICLLEMLGTIAWISWPVFSLSCGDTKLHGLGES